MGSPSWGWWGREGRWAQPSLTGTLARKQGQRTEKGLGQRYTARELSFWYLRK